MRSKAEAIVGQLRPGDDQRVEPMIVAGQHWLDALVAGEVAGAELSGALAAQTIVADQLPAQLRAAQLADGLGLEVDGRARGGRPGAGEVTVVAGRLAGEDQQRR